MTSPGDPTEQPFDESSTPKNSAVRPEKSQPIAQWFRQCPWCGHAAEKVGQIPFRCPRCEFANFFGPVAAVGGLIIDDENRLLMVRRANDPGKGKWGLPGGFVDRDETIESALSREVREETGLVVTEYRYLMSKPNSYDYRGMIASVIDLFYECRVDAPELIQLETSELTSHGWFDDPTPNLEEMAFPSNRIAIEYWMSQQSG